MRDDDFELFTRCPPIASSAPTTTPVGIGPSLEMTTGGVAPCATWQVMPTHRRRGILTQLMRRQLDDLQPLASCSPRFSVRAVIYGGSATDLGAGRRPRRRHGASRFVTTPGLQAPRGS
jgi:hypothetical protein